MQRSSFAPLQKILGMTVVWVKRLDATAVSRQLKLQAKPTGKALQVIANQFTMYRIKNVLFWFIMVSATVLLGSFNEPEKTLLEVEVTQIKDLSGKEVVVRIYDEAGFAKTHLYKQSKAGTKAQLSFVFHLPAGKYAVTVYHDLNSNGELDRKFYGPPKEPAAFSNNYTPFGPPRFSSCAIEVKPGYNNTLIALEN